MIRHDEVITLVFPHQVRHGHHLQVHITEGTQTDMLLQVHVVIAIMMITFKV